MRNVQKFINKALPLIRGNQQLTYNQDQNVFLTKGYTSLAGNTYFNGLRLSERILILTDIGIGYRHTFLNRLRIVSVTNPKITFVDKRFHCNFYSEFWVKYEAKKFLKEFLINQAKEEDFHLDQQWLNKFVTKLIEDTYNNQIENLKNIKGNNLLSGDQGLFLQ